MPRHRSAPTDTDLALLQHLRESGLSLRQVAQQLSLRDPLSLPWTRWQVWYYQHRERYIDAESGNERPLTASEVQCRARRRYQLEKGWAYLLPDIELRPALVDVLSVVRDYGPLTRRQIAARLGRHPDLCDTHGRARLTVQLCRLRLLAGLDWPARYWLTRVALKAACQSGDALAYLNLSFISLIRKGVQGRYFPVSFGEGDLSW